MSLTRDEWEQMWKTIQYISKLACDIEEESRNLKTKVKAGMIDDECSLIKNQIQAVIGQMK